MRPKLLHICYQFHPEMGYDVNLFLRFAHPGMEVKVLTSDNLDLWKMSAAEAARKDQYLKDEYNVEIVRLPSFKTGKRKAGVFINGLNKAINSMNPDIVFYHGLESTTFAWSIFNQVGKRFVAADTHTLFGQFRDLSFLGNIYLKGFFKPLLVGNMKKWNCPVFYTAVENKRVLEWFGFPESQIFNNEICTDVELFRKVEVDRKDIFPEMLPDGKVILYTGKFDHFKQPGLILEALKKVEQDIDFALNVVFVGPENPDYQNTNIRNIFDNSNIKVLVFPAVPNALLHRYYSAADIAVFPRQNTLSALDAQACGLPVIMESDETNRERLKDGGLCYESGNMADLGKKMLELLVDNGLRNSLSEAGRDYMQNRYNYKKKITEIQEMLLSGFLSSRFNKNGVIS